MNLSTFASFKGVGSAEGLVEISGEILQCVQKILTEMLLEFGSFCDARGIEWCVCGGTCLGAVRHGGFIPWDDDVDVFMPRESFERFRRVFDDGLGDRYCLHTPETSGYGLNIARVRMKGTVYEGQWDSELDNRGLFIDIFILENVPKNTALRTMHGMVSLALGLATSSSRCYRFNKALDPFLSDEGELAKALRAKIRICKILSFRSMEAWCVSWDRWNSRYRDNGSRRVSCPAGRLHYFGEMYERSDFFPSGVCSFNGISVRLPRVPEVYLKALYGDDYMTPPAESDRETHVILALDLGGNL